jgi:tRNA pseudouridine38-40 synthase
MTEVRTIRLTVAYDGTDFSGWQRQESDRSVQGELERALTRLHKAPVKVVGSGRTDSGVHAAGQVAHFHSPVASIPAEKYVLALNALLPRDVRILESRQASADFHARFDARCRTYRYFVICGRPALPHELRYAWQIWRRPRIETLNAMAASLLGETRLLHLRDAEGSSESRCRYISHARFHPEGDSLVFEIRANAFLWKMVRSVVGSLLHYEEKGFLSEDFAAVVASRDRSRAGPTAPPQGLFLWRIDYYRD